VRHVRDIEPLLISDRAEARLRWDALNGRSIAASAFTEFGAVEALADMFKWDLAPVFWGEDLAACFIIRQRGFSKDIVVPPLSPYSCIALSNTVPINRRSEVLNGLFEPIKGLPDARLISLDPTLHTFAEAPPSYSSQPKQTYFLECFSLENAVRGFSESTRRLFKKGRDSFNFVTNDIPLHQLGDLVAAGYESHGKHPPLCSSDMARLAESMIQMGFAQVVGVNSRQTGTLEAGIVLLRFGSMAWYWLAGSVRGPAMTVLLAHTLDHLSTQEVQRLDLMGANTEGITEFKRRFGGELTTYLHLGKTDVRNSVVSRIGQMLRFAQALTGSK